MTSPKLEEGAHVPVRAANDTKERIYSAAAKLFADKGYHATSVQELCTEVGIARGALYYHVKTKEELLDHIVLEVLETAVRDAERIAARPLGCEAKARRLAAALLHNLTQCHDEWMVTIRESSAVSAPTATRVAALRDAYEDIWRDTFAEGAATGELSAVDDIARKGILGMFNHSFAWIAGYGPLTVKRIADEFVDLVFDGIAVRRAG